MITIGDLTTTILSFDIFPLFCIMGVITVAIIIVQIYYWLHPELGDTI
jgi:hypothetical protein